jgi:hypothetical protein
MKNILINKLLVTCGTDEYLHIINMISILHGNILQCLIIFLIYISST